MRVSRYFTSGVMNSDSDERLLQNGQYRYAENIRVTQGDGSNAGLVENVKGTKQLFDFTTFDDKFDPNRFMTIGTGQDSFDEKIYWLVKGNGIDYLLEYTKLTNQTVRVLAHKSVLNLSIHYPVNEIHVIKDSYSGETFVAWTDNFNPPRIVNVNRAKTWGINGFIEDDIALIKKPPRFAPQINMISSPTLKENNIEEKFLAFAYRYKYLDGEYSALSSFSNVAFTPKAFELDFATKENVGMINQFNAVDITFNTGSKRVVGIDLVFKESGSNTIYKVQTFNKSDENWSDNVVQTFMFINDKVYSVLPEKELYRPYDAIPLKAGDLSVIDNRIVLGDITEGRNMVDSSGNSVHPDYSLSLVGGPLEKNSIPYTLSDTFSIDFNGIELSEGNKLSFNVSINNTEASAYYSGNFEYTLTRDYVDLSDLLSEQSFVTFIEEVWTSSYIDGVIYQLSAYTELLDSGLFEISPIGSSSGILTIKAPIMSLRFDLTPLNPNDDNWYYFTRELSFKQPTRVSILNYPSSSSLKSNRSYEVGMLYMDAENRTTPTLVDSENTLFVPIDRSTYKNQIQVELKNNPPEWADRYKFVIKSNKFGHETLYMSTFYVDGVYRWGRLDGANVNKVKEGDYLIVKSDIEGPLDSLVKVRVIEAKYQEENFLNTFDDVEYTSFQESGFYIKFRPNGFDLGVNDATQKYYFGYDTQAGESNPNISGHTDPPFGQTGSSFTPYPIKSGSTVTITIKIETFEPRGELTRFVKNYIVQNDYESYQEWFETEVGDFDEWGDEYLSDFGFSDDGSNFYITRNNDSVNNRFATIEWNVYSSAGLIIFETEPKELDVDVYYECSDTFEIEDGYHKGNVQNQDNSRNAIILLDSFNCFAQGNGAESAKIKDTFNGNALHIDLRPTITLDDEYKQRRLFSTFTWGGVYEESTRYNSLNEFNRSTLNIRSVDDKYGPIRRMISRENNLFLFQEDKVSYVLYRKKALFNQDGSANVGATDSDFGDQIPFTGLYGVSNNPESVVAYKNRIYFTDVKRGTPCRLSIDGIEEMPGYHYDTGNIRREHLSTWFKELFRNGKNLKLNGVYDPEYEEYIVSYKLIALRDKPGQSLGYCESANGWTSFYTYNPDMMVSMNGKLYGFKSGNLFEFNSDANRRNYFFDRAYPSKIRSVMNDSPKDVKVFNALNIESDSRWAFTFHTDLVNGTIKRNEFRKIENEWYANFRKGESVEFNSLATQGIGFIENASVNTITFSNTINASVSVGDELFIGDNQQATGIITSIEGNVIKIDNLIQSSNIGQFAFAQKNMRVEGSEIRGYFLDFEMVNTEPGRVELFSVNTEINKSYP